MAYADNEGPDQTLHLRCLLRTFIIRLQKTVKSDQYLHFPPPESFDIVEYDAQSMKWALMHFENNVRRSRLACASVQSNLGIFCMSTYTTVSTDSVSGQRRPRSACAYAQADQGLRCPQIT